jgi:hypothetical protein
MASGPKNFFEPQCSSGESAIIRPWTAPVVCLPVAQQGTLRRLSRRESRHGSSGDTGPPGGGRRRPSSTLCRPQGPDSGCTARRGGKERRSPGKLATSTLDHQGNRRSLAPGRHMPLAVGTQRSGAPDAEFSYQSAASGQHPHRDRGADRTSAGSAFCSLATTTVFEVEALTLNFCFSVFFHSVSPCLRVGKFFFPRVG